jgi:hypothetical protein
MSESQIDLTHTFFIHRYSWLVRENEIMVTDMPSSLALAYKRVRHLRSFRRWISSTDVDFDMPPMMTRVPSMFRDHRRNLLVGGWLIVAERDVNPIHRSGQSEVGQIIFCDSCA